MNASTQRPPATGLCAAQKPRPVGRSAALVAALAAASLVLGCEAEGPGEPVICADFVCPRMRGYEATCNTASHCEYRGVRADAPWRLDDVWIHIPAGRFTMGTPEGEPGEPNERPTREVAFADGFFIQRVPVTVRMHEACEFQGVCTEPVFYDGHPPAYDVNRSANGRADHPQNGLDRAQAQQVCAWLGGRLPHEAEWEYAAKGEVHQRYPWGDAPEPTCDLAVFNHLGGLIGGGGCGTETTAPAASRPAGASPFGVLDMAGNVSEWVVDCYHPTYFAAPTDGTAWVNYCPGTPVGVVRGGHFLGLPNGIRTTTRFSMGSGVRITSVGVRCVKDALAP